MRRFVSKVERWTQSRCAFEGKLCLLACLALALRLIHVRTLYGALGTAQIHDAAYYHDVAQSLLGRPTLSNLDGQMAFANLGYPYVLTWVYAFTASPTAVLVLQAVFGAATTALIGLLTRALFSSACAGLWAAAFYACYAPAIFYDGLLLVPSSSALLAALLGWSLLIAIQKQRLAWLSVAGVAIGAATLLRASQLLWLPFTLAAVIFARSQAAQARRLGVFAVPLLLLSSALCIAPVVLTQHASTGTWIPITTNGGMNFWIGNHQGAPGSYAVAPFLGSSQGGDYQHTLIVERDRFLAEARRRSGDPTLSLARASGFWWQETAREIRAAPGAWLGALGRKSLLVLNDYESRTNASFELMQELSPILGWNPLRFGLLTTFAALGATQLRRPRQVRARWVLGSLLAAPALTCLLFFVSGEYRHPAAVALAVLAGFGMQQLRCLFTSRHSWRHPSLLSNTLLPLAVAAVAFLPLREQGSAKDRKAYAEALASANTDGSAPTFERYGLARALLAEHDDTPQAQVLTDEALLLVESNQAIQFQDLHAAERLAQTADALWRRDLQADRDLDAATIERIRKNLVRRVAQLCRQPFVREAERGAWPELGIRLAREAVRHGPYDESLHYVLGELMLAHASGQATVEFFDAELSRDAKPQTSHYFIAMGLARQGNIDGAIQHLQQALAIDPAHEMSQRQWGLLLERQGQLVPALEHLVEATRIHPEYRAALLDVARLADELGHPERAEQWRARARSAPPSSPRRFVYWARYLHQHGRNEAALSELARRLQEAPEDEEALALRATILAGAGP